MLRQSSYANVHCMCTGSSFTTQKDASSSELSKTLNTGLCLSIILMQYPHENNLFCQWYIYELLFCNFSQGFFSLVKSIYTKRTSVPPWSEGNGGINLIMIGWIVLCLLQIRLIIFKYQWNVYKATAKFCFLPRQVVTHEKENKHDFVKTVRNKWLHLWILVRLPQFYHTGSTVACVNVFVSRISYVLYDSTMIDSGLIVYCSIAVSPMCNQRQ